MNPLGVRQTLAGQSPDVKNAAWKALKKDLRRLTGMPQSPGKVSKFLRDLAKNTALKAKFEKLRTQRCEMTGEVFDQEKNWEGYVNGLYRLAVINCGAREIIFQVSDKEVRAVKGKMQQKMIVPQKMVRVFTSGISVLQREAKWTGTIGDDGSKGTHAPEYVMNLRDTIRECGDKPTQKAKDLVLAAECNRAGDNLFRTAVRFYQQNAEDSTEFDEMDSFLDKCGVPALSNSSAQGLANSMNIDPMCDGLLFLSAHGPGYAGMISSMVASYEGKSIASNSAWKNMMDTYFPDITLIEGDDWYLHPGYMTKQRLVRAIAIWQEPREITLHNACYLPPTQENLSTVFEMLAEYDTTEEIKRVFFPDIAKIAYQMLCSKGFNNIANVERNVLNLQVQAGSKFQYEPEFERVTSGKVVRKFEELPKPAQGKKLSPATPSEASYDELPLQNNRYENGSEGEDTADPDAIIKSWDERSEEIKAFRKLVENPDSEDLEQNEASMLNQLMNLLEEGRMADYNKSAKRNAYRQVLKKAGLPNFFRKESKA